MRIQKVYNTMDVHVAGEAFRIIKDTLFIHYQSLDQLNEQFLFDFADEIKLLLNEPRGFAGLNGCLVVPPFHRDADAAIVFFNHLGTIPLHYGGIVAVITALLECGHLPQKKSNEYRLETVSGLISVKARMENTEVVSVQFESKPCLVVKKEIPLSHPYVDTHFSLVQADQLYAVFEKRDFTAEIRVEELSELKAWSQTIFKTLGSKGPIKAAVLLDDSQFETNCRIKTITFRDDLYIVRSPGFGATLASFISLLAKLTEPKEEELVNESIFGSELKIRLANQTESGYQFIFSSRGFLTGMHTFVLDPSDPLAEGFLLK
ncbi:proline racemase family protein [Pseudoneobacillus sp. C159]